MPNLNGTHYVKYITYSISNTKKYDSLVKLVQMHIGSSCTDTAICAVHVS